MSKVPTVKPDEFQVALATLAGLDPTEVAVDSIEVTMPGPNGKTALLRATVVRKVDANEVVRLALEHGRIGVAR